MFVLSAQVVLSAWLACSALDADSLQSLGSAHQADSFESLGEGVEVNEEEQALEDEDDGLDESEVDMDEEGFEAEDDAEDDEVEDEGFDDEKFDDENDEDGVLDEDGDQEVLDEDGDQEVLDEDEHDVDEVEDDETESSAEDEESLLQTRLQEEANVTSAWRWPWPFFAVTCHPDMGQTGHHLETPMYGKQFTASHEACAHACLMERRCELFQYEASKKECSLRTKAFKNYDQSGAAKGKELCVFGARNNQKFDWIYACWQNRKDTGSRTINTLTKFGRPQGPQCAKKCWENPKCKTFDWTVRSCRLSGDKDKKVVSSGGIQHCRVYGHPYKRRYGKTAYPLSETCQTGVFFTSGPKIKTVTGTASRKACLSKCGKTKGCDCYIYDPVDKKCNLKSGCHPKVVGRNRFSKKHKFLSCMVKSGACDPKEKFKPYPNYRGTQTKTISGRTCQKWTSQTPHKKGAKYSNDPKSGRGDHNYCRNANKGGSLTGKLVCYTMDPKKRSEECKPLC